ncbi:MAG TPA: WYL domain-containing protein [Rhizomicrobium sp.]|nr:WYL domain-containing protein [Rhizomicrobium sp.]
MLASRLLSILMLLQTRGRMSATALAAEFEVSVRTIHRDIDQLSAAGIPVFADRGRNGGFALLDGYRTKLTGLTQPEAETLLLAGLPGPAAELGLADILSAARLKLLAALPAHVQPGAERIAARFHLDPAPWFRVSDPQPALQTVARAVWSGNALKIGYRSEGDVRSRKLHPFGLVLKAGGWYLVAQSQSGEKTIRTYRVANIVDVEILEETFARPRSFDLAAHWEKSSRDYERGVYRGHADVRLSPKGLALLDLLGPYVKAAAQETATPERDGWMRCRIPIESPNHGVQELLRLRDEVELLGPPPLRKLLMATLADITRHHKPKRRPE